MTTKSEIENAILDATGRPDSGVIRDNLGAMADAIMQLVSPIAAAPTTETDKDVRIVKTEETR